MQKAIEDLLAAQGYDNYETSAFARPGARCRHNLNYWLFGDYIGVGAGAHAKLSFPDRVLRETRYRQPREFMAKALAGNAIQETHEVGTADLGFEFMMNALRLNGGFDVPLFAERAGVPLAVSSETAAGSRTARADHPRSPAHGADIAGSAVFERVAAAFFACNRQA